MAGTAGTGATVNIASGTAYIPNSGANSFENFTGLTGLAVSSGTFYLDWDGGATSGNFYLVSTSTPAAGRMRLAQIVSSGTAITSIADLRPVSRGPVTGFTRLNFGDFLSVYGGDNQGV